MAGTILRVLEKNTYAFTAATLPLNQIAKIPVAINVDASWAVYGSLIVRAHAFSVGAGAGTFPYVKALAYPSAPTSEDPATLYRTSGAVITSTQINATAAPFTPAVSVDANATPGNLGGFLDIELWVAQWAATTAGNISVAVSIDLVLKA